MQGISSAWRLPPQCLNLLWGTSLLCGISHHLPFALCLSSSRKTMAPSTTCSYRSLLEKYKPGVLAPVVPPLTAAVLSTGQCEWAQDGAVHSHPITAAPSQDRSQLQSAACIQPHTLLVGSLWRCWWVCLFPRTQIVSMRRKCGRYLTSSSHHLQVSREKKDVTRWGTLETKQFQHFPSCSCGLQSAIRWVTMSFSCRSVHCSCWESFKRLAGESVCARATEARSPVVGAGHPHTENRFLG